MDRTWGIRKLPSRHNRATTYLHVIFFRAPTCIYVSYIYVCSFKAQSCVFHIDCMCFSRRRSNFHIDCMCFFRRRTTGLDEEKRIASMERSTSNQCAHTLHNFPHPTCIEQGCCAKSLRILNVFFGFLCSHATKLLTACMYRMRALSETSQHFLCIFRISDVMSCAMHFPTHTPEVYNTRVTQYVYHTMLYSNF